MHVGRKIKCFKFVHQFILRNFFTAVEFFKEQQRAHGDPRLYGDPTESCNDKCKYIN